MLLLEEGVFTQPYSISYIITELIFYRKGRDVPTSSSVHLLQYYRVNFFIDTMLLPEGGGFYTALIHIGTSLVSYKASA